MILLGLPVQLDDGGRAAAGFKGETQDCVVRSIAIATRPGFISRSAYYADVYRALADGLAAIGRPASPGKGVPRSVYGPLLEKLGWTWTPCSHIGSRSRVHLRPGELPGGTLIVRTSHHLTVVIDGIVHDNHDPCRDGTRMVYGYYRREA